MVRLALTDAGLRALAEAGLRIDVEACLLPHAGAHDGQAPFPTYLVASLDPATSAAGSAVASNTGADAVAFALSWQALAASGALPGGPHAVVLFVQALPRASFVTKPLTGSGCLDSAALASLSAHHCSPCVPPQPLTPPSPFFGAAIAPQPVYDDAQDAPMADAAPSPPRTPPRANAHGQQSQFHQFHQPQQLQRQHGGGRGRNRRGGGGGGGGGGGLWF